MLALFNSLSLHYDNDYIRTCYNICSVCLFNIKISTCSNKCLHGFWFHGKGTFDPSQWAVVVLHILGEPSMLYNEQIIIGEEIHSLVLLWLMLWLLIWSMRQLISYQLL